MYHFVTFDGVTRVRERFQHAKDADEFMCDAWNERVKPQDHIYHLGDVAMNFAPWVHRVKSLPGHKRLILGNHDKGKMTEYLSAGFEKILSVRMLDRKVAIMSHFPLHPDSVHRLNIHGHIHERVINDPHYVNVCVEHTDYAPVELEEILSRKKDL